MFDTRGTPPRDRANSIRDALSCVDIEFDESRGPAQVTGSIVDFGRMTVCSVLSNAITARRTTRHLRDESRPNICVGLLAMGTGVVSQFGRDAILRPGELVLFVSDEPYVLSDKAGLRLHVFQIPMDLLGLSTTTVRDTAARTLRPDNPVADLVSTYLLRVATRPEMSAVPGADALSDPSIALVRALITTSFGEEELTTPLLTTLPLRILEYARAHLGDPNLNAATVAEHHHISVRHLYNVLAADGVTFADWVRTHRLEGCRAEISQVHAEPVSIGTISRRWGFHDQSSFARAFKREYGIPPTRVRPAGR